jgi:MFS family permease
MGTEARATEREASEPDAPALLQALPPPVAAGLVFGAAGAVLVLEILAVRLLAPYVGLTLEATTAIIGAALAGISVGAAVGGYLADRTNTRLLVVALLILGGLLSLLTVPIVRWLGPGARKEGDLVALGITFVALVPAAAVLSAVSPAVAHLQLRDLRASGTIVGGLSAWATAGALLGTFGTGFVLVPLMPVSSAVLLTGAALILIGLLLGLVTELLPPAGVAGVVVGALLLGGFSVTFDSPCQIETRYHCAYVEADPTREGGYHLLLDDGYHSYVDVNDHTYLQYPYTAWVAGAIDSTYPPGRLVNMVVVGGGGFTLPLWLEATRPGSLSEVLEVDGELVDFVEDRFQFQASESLRVTLGDARLTIRDLESDSADVVLGDAYSSDSVPWHLATAEWVEEVRRVLKPGGIYMQNILDFQPLDLARAEAATLLDTFSDVRFVTYKEAGGRLFGGSMVLFASDLPMEKMDDPKIQTEAAFTPVAYKKPEVISFAGDAEVLRDDFAPADQLLTPES